MNNAAKLILLLATCYFSDLAASTKPAPSMSPVPPTSRTKESEKRSPLINEPQGNHALVDKICAIVDSEQPILLSEVEKKSKELNVSMDLALKELLFERALRIYGKQLKFSSTDTHKAAEDHIMTIMKNNNLTREKFQAILRGPPYFTTLKQYEYETAFAILKNQIESSFASTINITDKELENAKKQYSKSDAKSVEVVFISILPTRSDLKDLEKGPATNQFKKANTIKSKLLSKLSLESVKIDYKNQKDVSFIGPVDYEEGILSAQYEFELKKNPLATMIGPFEDGRAVTLILRIEKALSPDKLKTALENVRNDLYKKAVRQRLDAVTNGILANVPVEVNCAW